MIQPNRFVVPEALAGSRIDLFLARQDPEHSRSLYQRAIAEGRVRLNGRRAKKWERVAAGDAVDVEPFEPAGAGPLPDPSVPLVVVHEDEALLVVDKAAGVPVHPHRPTETGTLAGALIARCPELAGIGPQPLEPGLVHRLDTQTSGLLVVARTPAAFRALASAFAERRVEKVYLALVLGSPPAIGSIATPIGHHPTDKRRMVVEGDPAGPPRSPRPAVTHFAVRRRYVGYTELEVRTATGRMHQIRAHLASIGHPLAGDALYQKPAEFARDRLGLARPFLHAARLAFDHPVDGRRVEFSAPLPPDLVTALARLPEAGSAEPRAAEPPPRPAKRAVKRTAPVPRTFIRRPGGGRREMPSPPAEGAGSSPSKKPLASAPGARRAPGEAARAAVSKRPTGRPRPGEVFGVNRERPRQGDRQARDARRAGALKPARRPSGHAGRPDRDGQRATERAPRGGPPVDGRSRPARPARPPARRAGSRPTPPEDRRLTPRPRRADDRRREGPTGGGPARWRSPEPSRFPREERPRPRDEARSAPRSGRRAPEARAPGRRDPGDARRGPDTRGPRGPRSGPGGSRPGSRPRGHPKR